MVIVERIAIVVILFVGAAGGWVLWKASKPAAVGAAVGTAWVTYNAVDATYYAYWQQDRLEGARRHR